MKLQCVKLRPGETMEIEGQWLPVHEEVHEGEYYALLSDTWPNPSGHAIGFDVTPIE